MHDDEYRSPAVLQRQLDDHLLSDPYGLVRRYRGLLARRDEAKKAHKQIDQHVRQEKGLQKQINALTKQLADVKALYYELRDQRDELRERSRALQREIRQQADRSEHELERSRDAMLETKKDLAREQGEAADLRAEVQRLRSELERVRVSRSMRIGRAILWPWHAGQRAITGQWPNARRAAEIEPPREVQVDSKGTEA